MNPTYSLKIITTIALHKSRRNITLQFHRYIDFVPQNGMTIRFTNDEEGALDVEFDSLYYDYTNKVFVQEQEDLSLLDGLRQSDGPECTITPEQLKGYVEWYESFGWEKTNVN